MSSFPSAAQAVRDLQQALAPGALILLNRAAAAETADGNSGALEGRAQTLAVDIEITALAGTSPTIQFVLERRDATGAWRAIHTTAVLSAVGVTSLNVGPGLPVNVALTDAVRLRWLVTGSLGQSITFAASIVGRS